MKTEAETWCTVHHHALSRPACRSHSEWRLHLQNQGRYHLQVHNTFLVRSCMLPGIRYVQSSNGPAFKNTSLTQHPDRFTDTGRCTSSTRNLHGQVWVSGFGKLIHKSALMKNQVPEYVRSYLLLIWGAYLEETEVWHGDSCARAAS